MTSWLPAQGDLWRGFKIGWWFGFGFHFAGLYWIGGAFLVQAEVFAWLLPIAVTLMPAGLALFHGAAVAVVACVSGSALTRVLVLALAISASEWLRGNILTGFPWNVLGYALTYPLVLMQSAAVVGIFGLTLATVVIFGSPLVVLAEAQASRHSRPGLAIVACTVAPVLAMVAYGALVLAEPVPETVPGVRLRLVQPSIPQVDKFDPEKRREIFRRHLDLSRHGPGGADAGFQNVTHVIWPEAALPFLGLRSPEVLRQIGDEFPDDVVLVLGTLRLDGPLVRDGRKLKVYNSAATISGTGGIIDHYDKVHLVPFGEYLPFQETLESIGLEQLTRIRGGFAVGRTPRPPLRIPGLPQTDMLICYEVIFPDEVVTGERRPGLLVNITNDAWYGKSTGPFQHFHQARVRSVEQGIPMIRVANNGVSASVDARGRIIAKLGLDEVGAVDSELHQPIAPTTYAKFGDNLYWGVWLILLLLLNIAGCRKKLLGI